MSGYFGSLQGGVSVNVVSLPAPFVLNYAASVYQNTGPWSFDVITGRATYTGTPSAEVLVGAASFASLTQLDVTNVASGPDIVSLSCRLTDDVGTADFTVTITVRAASVTTGSGAYDIGDIVNAFLVDGPGNSSGDVVGIWAAADTPGVDSPIDSEALSAGTISHTSQFDTTGYSAGDYKCALINGSTVYATSATFSVGTATGHAVRRHRRNDLCRGSRLLLEISG